MGVFAAVLLLGSIVWLAEWSHINPASFALSDGPTAPIWPSLLGGCGLGVVVSALVWALARWIEAQKLDFTHRITPAILFRLTDFHSAR